MYYSAALIALNLLLSAAAVASDIDAASVKIRALFPADQPLDIEPTAGGRLLEVTAGVQMFYATPDGEFLLPGPLLEVATRKNLTEDKLAQVRRRLVDRRPADFFVTYPAAAERHQVTVLTDIDCTFCRRLHTQMDGYNELGITMRYVLVSRQGLQAPAFRKAVNAWCAKEKTEAVTLAMSGENLSLRDCRHPLEEHHQLAQELGLSSTPSLILPDGSAQVGYLPPDQLAAKLDAIHD